MRRNLLYIIVVFSMIWHSCQPEPLILDDVPVADSKIVVSNIIGGDQLVSVFLTKSFGALEGDIEENPDLLNNYIVPNARLTIAYQNNRVLLDEIGFGIYGTNDITLITGEKYMLDVYNTENGENVKAESEVKAPVFFESVSVDSRITSIDTIANISYALQDLPGKNYYMINTQKASAGFSPEQLISNRVFTHLFKDEEDGARIEGSFSVFIRNVEVGDTLMISLSNISQEYYNYLEKINNGFLGPSLITEPFNYPSNVNGGYGFFNLHYFDNRFMIFED